MPGARVLVLASAALATAAASRHPNIPCSTRVAKAAPHMVASPAPASVSTSADVVVVGSGVSGSSLGFHLAKEQEVGRVFLAEAKDEVGGNVITKRNEEGFLWEEGPNTFQPTAQILRLAYDVGLADDLVLADAKAPRLVYFEGKLYPLPLNNPLVDGAINFDLVSWPGKIRAALGAMGLPGILQGYSGEGEESIESFVSRHLGREVFAKVIDPFVSGVYAGDPSKLAMRWALKKIFALEARGFNAGLLSGGLERFAELQAERKSPEFLSKWRQGAELLKSRVQGGALGSFKNGLQSLPRAVSDCLGAESVHTGWKLRRIARGDDGSGYVVTFETSDGGEERVVCKAVALTIPSHAYGEVLSGLDGAGQVMEALNRVRYPAVASVTLAYKSEWIREDVGAPLQGFGHLIPRSEGVRTLGTIWSSSLFPGRAPAGWEMVLSYIGGSRDPGLADLSDDEIIAQVDADVKRVLIKEARMGEAPKVLGCRVWPTAIPQYEKGHGKVLEAIEAFERKNPGIYLGGNYRTGVAFGDCVAFGADEAERIACDLPSLRAPAPPAAAEAEAPTAVGTGAA